jgi:hypothetical protein
LARLVDRMGGGGRAGQDLAACRCCRGEAIARIARLIGLAAKAVMMIEIDDLAIASPLRSSMRRFD